MGTPYTDIYDLAMVSIADWHIDNLYLSSTPNYYNYMEGFLLKAIPKFTNCVQDLTDRDDTTQVFNITLTDTEKMILSDWVVYCWLEKNIQDVRQMNLNLNDTDFKHYAEGQNLKEKSERLDRLRERLKQDDVDYNLKNVNWTNWASGNYA